MIQKAKEKSKPVLRNEAALATTMTGMMDKTTGFVRHFDTQASILVGISSAMTFFALSMVQSGVETLSFAVLGFFSMLSVLTGLYSVHPPRYMRKKDKKRV